MKKLGVVVFPGSNCDHDLYHVLKHNLGQDVRFVWHKETDIADLSAAFLPGGFSYGDYLRGGAIARFSPVMNEVIKFANAGKFVVGICNGFQILCEAGLLPGALLRNENLEFACHQVYAKVETTDSIFTQDCCVGQLLKMPIAHGEGNYFASKEDIAALVENDQILFKYSDAGGVVNAASNPNGSINGIAGIRNRNGNVLGMMPHPERAADEKLGSADGKIIFTSVLQSV